MARPLKYKTEEELQEKSLGYINFINDKDETAEHPLGVTVKDVPTKSGLRIWLDIDGHTYFDYKKRFPNALKKVENIIEDCWVQRLAGNNVAGSIFYLKNAFQYRDRQETDITSGGEKITPLLGGQSYGNKNLGNRKTPEAKEED